MTTATSGPQAATSMLENATIQRDSVSWKNEQELLRLMHCHNFQISPHNFRLWRPTVRQSGDIPGVWQNVTIIATDGLQGFFLLGDTETIVIGHIQMFSGEVKTMFGLDKPIKQKLEKKKRKSATSLELALDLLKSLQPK